MTLMLLTMMMRMTMVLTTTTMMMLPLRVSGGGGCCFAKKNKTNSQSPQRPVAGPAGSGQTPAAIVRAGAFVSPSVSLFVCATTVSFFPLLFVPLAPCCPPLSLVCLSLSLVCLPLSLVCLPLSLVCPLPLSLVCLPPSHKQGVLVCTVLPAVLTHI